MKLRKKHTKKWANVKNSKYVPYTFIPSDWIEFLNYLLYDVNGSIFISFFCDKCNNHNDSEVSVKGDNDIDGYIIGQHITLALNLTCNVCHYTGDYKIKITQKEIDIMIDNDVFETPTGCYYYCIDNTIFKA